MSRAPLPDSTRSSLLVVLILCVASAAAQDAEQFIECSQNERDNYLQTLRQILVENWRVPVRNRYRSCTVVISQNFRGEVLNAGVDDCSDDPALIKSIEDAVYLSSPLPTPDNRDCFARIVRLRLVPKPD